MTIDESTAATRAIPRIVVLTIGGRFGIRVLEALRARGIIPHAVMIEARTALRDCFHHRTTGGRIRELPLVPLRALWRYLRPRTRRDLRIGAPVVVTGPLNSSAMRRDLVRMRPDLLVLAGTGIVSAELLDVPRLGTVNVHLGLLPWIRGNDVVAHSVLEGVPVGATCHMVDRGIDTGPLLVRRLLDVSTVEASLGALEAASITLGVGLLTECVTAFASGRALPAATPQRERLPLHRFLSAERRAEADGLIRSGVARTLFDEWVQFAMPGSHDLPPTVTPPSAPRGSPR